MRWCVKKVELEMMMMMMMYVCMYVCLCGWVGG